MTTAISKTQRAKFARELKRQLRQLSDSKILGLAAGRVGFAVFSDLKEIHLSSHFSPDGPDGANEQYWDRRGVRANVPLFFDPDLYELPLDWQEQLDAIQGEAGSEFIQFVRKAFVSRGMTLAADEWRHKSLLQAEEAIDDACNLAEILSLERDLRATL